MSDRLEVPRTIFPLAYYDAERTVDIKIPGAQRTVRIWLDALEPGWVPEAIVMLARGIRANHTSSTTMEQVIDMVCSLKGVNAAQVIDYIEAGGYSVGLVAYTKRFDREDAWVAAVKAWWRRLWRKRVTSA